MGPSDSRATCSASQHALLGLVRPLVVPVGERNRAPLCSLGKKTLPWSLIPYLRLPKGMSGGGTGL